MLTKFETKSNRVKGLAFHPKRPWILASLHSGVIQLWDYRMGTLIDRFAEHDGPVRGVEFHGNQPIFVSGGDDYKVKVWSYKTRRCLFTLTGHLDYVRTVQFHPEHPWVVSASDDQTVRIWNWQARNCMAVLTGHNHYVMCAAFHRKEDLVVSASLDQTVRVWDISGLRKKLVTPGGQESESSINADLFGGGDAVVKYVLEGHERGVNWASFHPTLPLIVSGADDRMIKLWRMNDTKAWEVDSLRGHLNNVSCVIFNGKQDLIISDSEDRTIRVWDMSRRTALQTFRREHDRFWILAAHPEINLLAAGHDSGMIVFKLARERPAAATHGSSVYYVSERNLRHYDTATGRGTLLQMLPKPANWNPKSSVVRSMSYNPAEHAVLLNLDEEGGTFKLFMLPQRDGGVLPSRGEVAENHAGVGQTAVFVARNRFAVWDRVTSTIQIRNLSNEITKRCPAPDATCNGLFYAGTGMLLCRCEDKVILFDVQQRLAVAELQTAPIKTVAWDSTMSRAALLSKHVIVLTDSKLSTSCTVHETIRVKSAVWSDSGVLIYTTLNHIKYCLPNGDSGIIQTLDMPIYVVALVGDTVHALDREGKTRTLQVDTTEFMFKQALANRKYDTVLKLIRSGKLCGQALIAFLREKGFPEVALHFAEDDRTRFQIAIECGNIEVALQTARKLDDPDIIHQLGLEAFRQGNLDIAEWSFQQIKGYDRLSFMYAVTGNTEKLAKMLKIVEMRGDTMAWFRNALYLGSMRSAVKALKSAGHNALAYVAASTHGLEEEAAELAEVLGDSAPEVPATAGLMMPPTPILRQANWPLLASSLGALDGQLMDLGAGKDAEDLDLGNMDAGAWGDELGLPGEEVGEAGQPGGAVAAVGDGDDEEGGWEMEDLELPPDMPTMSSVTTGPFVAPAPGQTVSQRWQVKSALPAEHVACGAFDNAMRALKLQLGITNFAPLKQNMLAVRASAFAYTPGLPGMGPVAVSLDASWSKEPATAKPVLPATPGQLPALDRSLKAAYKLFTDGKFADALSEFTGILLALPLVVVATRREVDEVKEMVSACKEYHVALRCEMKRKETTDNPIRAAELAAYFTHCSLQPAHRLLTLRVAMNLFYKLKLFASCATFCRRILELNPPEKFATQAKQVLAICEKTSKDETPVQYDPRNPFDLCAETFVPLYRGSQTLSCPFSGAKFAPECKGHLSAVGEVAKVGADASGLLCSHVQIR